MKPNGRVRRDKKERKRQRKGLFWVPVMVALGLWPEKREKRILDWEIGNGPGEDAGSWLKLLTRLEERGVRGAKGLRLIIHDGGAGLEEALDEVHFAALRQRCLFHKLRNVLEAIRFPDEVQREEARRVRRQILQEASAIWQAADKENARQRQEDFCTRWTQSQPEAVETLCRDFADTLAFYDVLAWASAHDQPAGARESQLSPQTTPNGHRPFRNRAESGALSGHYPHRTLPNPRPSGLVWLHRTTALRLLLNFRTQGYTICNPGPVQSRAGCHSEERPVRQRVPLSQSKTLRSAQSDEIRTMHRPCSLITACAKSNREKGLLRVR